MMATKLKRSQVKDILGPTVGQSILVSGTHLGPVANPKKSPGYDLITGKILKELPIIGTKYLTQLFNAILLLNYCTQWKVAQIILILKPGKLPHALPSYRPINLLPIAPQMAPSTHRAQ
jgi:hypothetical protein